MPDVPSQHRRRSLRLTGYDYRQPGAYFITICLHQRLCLFGTVVDGVLEGNDAGRTIATLWEHLPERFPQLEADSLVVMPNHVHGILIINNGEGETLQLGFMVGAFKSLTTNEYIRGVRRRGWTPFAGTLWQRNFYEQVIRNDAALERARAYLINNPAQWTLDRENPDVEMERGGGEPGHPQGDAPTDGL